ncbi:MAG: branched-chain amino acid ABC transporter permease, partial [Desulfatiglandales bacterium]|nr:branched-chain amino acid ABC transporter permease [Desulfatiglandales bacterium]
MEIAVQLIIAGILQGGVYALAAFGLSLTFGVSDVLNLAHGEFLMLGGLVTFLLFSATGLNPFLTGLFMVPAAFFLGYIFDRFLMRPLATKKENIRLMSSILVTLGAAIFIEDVSSFLVGADEKGVDYSMPSFFWGDIYISYLRLLAMVMIAGLTVGIHYYLKMTYTGRALRATTQNLRGAMLVGVNTSQIRSVTFGISSILASIAGVFYVVLLSIAPDMGLTLTVKYLCIIVLGGLGSLIGSL